MDRTWMAKYWQLADYYCKHGHSGVSETQKNEKLYGWCQQLRQAQLTSTQKEMLERIDFEFEPLSWDDSYRLLVQFYSFHGHSDISVDDNTRLGKFVQVQRQELQDWWLGKETSLNFERVSLLHAINFAWEPADVDWLMQYHKLLQDFGVDEDDDDEIRPVAADQSFELKRDELQFDKTLWHLKCHLEDHDGKLQTLTPSLSAWVVRQRSEYAKFRQQEPSSMTVERIRKMQQLKISLSAKKQVTSKSLRDERWTLRLNQLRDFKTKHGHLNVPVTETSLGPWVYSIRQRFSRYHRKPEMASPSVRQKIKILNELGFVWNLREKQWLSSLNSIRPFVLSNGKLSQNLANPKLRKWWQSQKREYSLYLKGSKTSLTPSRIASLQQLISEKALQP